MKIIAAAILAVAMFGTTSFAASLTKSTYPTARKAATAGAAYRLDKAAGFHRFDARDLKVTKTIDGRGTMQKFEVQTKARFDGKPLKQLDVSVRKDAPAKYRAYIPNRHVYTPPSVGNP